MPEAIAIGVFAICVLVVYVALRCAYRIGYDNGYADATSFISEGE